VTKLIDDPTLADIAGPASLKLSNALLDYGITSSPAKWSMLRFSF
jgi:hypothetical protein